MGETTNKNKDGNVTDARTITPYPVFSSLKTIGLERELVYTDDL